MAEWTKEEIATLRECYPRLGAQACAEVLEGHSAKAIARRAERMGLRCCERDFWESEELEMLLALYKKHTWEEIATILGRTRAAVLGKARELRLQRAPGRPARVAPRRAR